MRNLNINISRNEFNEAFLDVLNQLDKRYIVLYGGAGSSKSYSTAQILIYLIIKEKIFNLLVVRNTGRSNRDSTFALLKQIISKWGLYKYFKINTSDMRITCLLNGNEIIFQGLDDVEKIKSLTFSKGELTDIWIEEASEILESDFNQLDIRLRGSLTKKHIFLTFNPIDVNHWLKRRFIDEKKEDAYIHHSTYKDNRFLDDEYIKLLESYKISDPYYYNVYCLGLWGVLGNTVFDANKITKRLQIVKQPLKVGSFLFLYNGQKISDIKWVDDVNGYISLYQLPNKLNYCIGGDTAGEGSDYFIGQVLDQYGNQVACLRQQMDSDLYTKQMYCLGKYYNNALIAIETNYDLFPIKELQRLGYLNMYVRQEYDTALEKYKSAYGFTTTSKTRPLILNHLIELVRDNTELFNDKLTLEEMLTFVRNEKGRMEAKNGAHDDLVMALAIAHEALNQVKPYKEKKVIIEDEDDKKSSLEYWG